MLFTQSIRDAPHTAGVESRCVRQTCPECAAEAGQIMNREITNSGIRTAFECAECSYRWTTDF
jgi:transposase-like protein